MIVGGNLTDMTAGRPESHRWQVGETVPVTMLCPNLKCGRTVVAAESARGKVVRCAHCQTLFLVPTDGRAINENKPAPAEEEAAPKKKGRR
jgi:hypothetical protein